MDYILSGATSPTNANGVYSKIQSFNGRDVFKHVSKNYYIYYDVEEAWEVFTEIPAITTTRLFYKYTSATTPLGYYSNDTGTGSVQIKEYSGSVTGTIGCKNIVTTYEDVDYVGADD